MAVSSIRRRMVFVKKTKNPRAPLPQRRTSSSRESKSESVFVAPPPRPTTGWEKYGKPAAIFVGLACVGILGGVLFSYSPTERTYDRAEASPKPIVIDQARPVIAIPGVETAQPALPDMLSQRTAATDESFRASSYTRLK